MKRAKEMASFKSNIWKMYLFKFFTFLHFFGGVLVPFFLEWGKISFTQIMILQSVFMISIFLFEVPTGAVADYLGRKTSLIIGAVVNIIAVFVYTSYPSFYVFIVGEILWAMTAALLSGADQALVYDSLKKIKQEKKSKKIYGRFNSFEIAALMIAAPIGSLIAATLGLRYAMMLMVVPILAATIIAFTLKEPKTKKKIESKRYMAALLSGIKYFKGHRILRILAFDRISIAVLIFFIVWTYQPKFMLLGVPIFYLGFIHAFALTGVQIPFMNNFERLERLFGGKKRYLLWNALIAGTGFIIFGLTTSIWIALIALTFIAGFGLTRLALFQSYLNKHIESHNRATVLSTVSMIDRFVRALIYPFIGILVEWSLNYTLVIIGILIIIFAFISRVREEHLLD